MTKIPENFTMQRRLNGLDVFQPASDLAPGDMSDLTNCYSYNGELYSRWGKQAGFIAVPSANPNYAVTEFVRTDGSKVIVFCNNGKLYWSTTGTPPLTWTEIKIGGVTSFSLNSPAVQMKKAGKYLYVVDGAGALYRVNVNADGTTTAVAVTALTPPKSASVALTNTTIDSMSSATGWSSFPALTWPNSTSVSNPETINNSGNQQFTGGTSSPSPDPQGWITGGDTMGFQASATGTGQEAYLDAGAGSEGVDWDYPTPTYPTTGGPAGGAPIGIKNARVWIGSADGHSSGGGQFQLIAFPEDASVTSQTLIQFTDLAIGAGGNTLTSAAHAFVAGDVGKVVTVFGGAAGTWTAGNYTITGVAAGVATVNGTVGTNGSTGGVGTKNLDSGGAAGDKNNTLQNPPSALAGFTNGVASPLFKCTATNTKYSNVFSFSNVGTDFDYIKLRLQGPAQNVGTGVNSPSFKVADVRLYASAVSGKLHVTANNVDGGSSLGGVWLQKDYTGGTSTAYTDLAVDATTNTIVTSALHPFQTSQVGQILVITSGAGWTTGNYKITAVDGSHKATLSASPAATSTTGGNGNAYTVQDFSTNNVVSIGYSAPSTTPQDAVQFRLGFLKAGQTIGNIIWSNLCTFETDGASFYVDISTIDITDSAARAQCAYFYIRIESDLPSSVNLADLFTLGPVTGAGNLSLNEADYYWVGVEAQDNSLDTSGNSTGNTTDGVVLSNPSGPSTPAIAPTSYHAQVQLAFPSSWQNTGANWLYVYRFGGALAGGGVTTYTSYALLDQCPRWAGTTNGQTATSTGAVGGGSWTWSATTNLWTSSDGFRTWNPATHVLTDNTPDTALIGNDFLNSGRGAPPTGATAIEMWNNRLVLAKGSTLYISDLLTTNTAAGLYYATTVDPEDPYAVTKGGIYPIEANDNDTIVQLHTHGQYLDVFKSASVHLFTGQDPISGFQSTPHLKDAGIGLAGGPQAVCAFDLNVAFAGPSAIHQYNAEPIHVSFGMLQSYENAEQAPVLSQKIEPLLAPFLKGGKSISKSAYQSMVLHYHGRRLWLFAPAVGGSSNSAAYVYDTRPATDGSGPVGWSKHTTFNVVSCCSLGGADDTDTFYMGGADGQIYQLAGDADVSSLIAVTGATNASPIVVTAATHGYTNGQKVIVTGVGGNTAANGNWYAGSVTTNTFALYQDSALTTPVAGNGAYTSSTGATGALTAIAWSVTSRGFMNEDNTFRYFKANRPTRAYFLLSTSESDSITFSVGVVGSTGGNGQPPNFTLTETINQQFADVRFKVPSEIKGYGAVTVGVSGSTKAQAKITAFGVEDAKGAIRGNV